VEDLNQQEYIAVSKLKAKYATSLFTLTIFYFLVIYLSNASIIEKNKKSQHFSEKSEVLSNIVARSTAYKEKSEYLYQSLAMGCIFIKGNAERKPSILYNGNRPWVSNLRGRYEFNTGKLIGTSNKGIKSAIFYHYNKFCLDFGKAFKKLSSATTNVDSLTISLKHASDSIFLKSDITSLDENILKEFKKSGIPYLLQFHNSANDPFILKWIVNDFVADSFVSSGGFSQQTGPGSQVTIGHIKRGADLTSDGYTTYIENIFKLFTSYASLDSAVRAEWLKNYLTLANAPETALEFDVPIFGMKLSVRILLTIASLIVVFFLALYFISYTKENMLASADPLIKRSFNYPDFGMIEKKATPAGSKEMKGMVIIFFYCLLLLPILLIFFGCFSRYNFTIYLPEYVSGFAFANSFFSTSDVTILDQISIQMQRDWFSVLLDYSNLIFLFVSLYILLVITQTSSLNKEKVNDSVLSKILMFILVVTILLVWAIAVQEILFSFLLITIFICYNTASFLSRDENKKLVKKLSYIVAIITFLLSFLDADRYFTLLLSSFLIFCYLSFNKKLWINFGFSVIISLFIILLAYTKFTYSLISSF
jgi:hypothetical protein